MTSCLPPDEESNDALVQLKQQLAATQAENNRLHAQLAQHTQTIVRLNRWLMGLQRAINAVHHSFTWQIGDKITRFILTLLRRSAGPTAFQQINSINTSFQYWLAEFKQQTQIQQCDLWNQEWHVASEYQAWQQQYFTLNATAKSTLLSQLNTLHDLPEMAVIIRVSLDINSLSITVNSLIAQIYHHWHIVLIAPDTIRTSIEPFLTDNIQAVFFHTNEAQTLTETVLALKQPYFLVLNSGDRLVDYALSKMVQTCQEVAPEALFWYSDHDYIDEHGKGYAPYFKPDWSPDLFYSHDYLQGAIVVASKTIAALTPSALTHLQQEAAPHWLYGLVLTLLAAESTKTPYHIRYVLFHKTAQAAFSTAAAKRLLENYFTASAQTVKITPLSSLPCPTFRVQYRLNTPFPLVSIIIPTKDKVALLENLINGLLTQTEYSNFEIIIIDNNSKEEKTLDFLKKITENNTNIKCLPYPKPFNYAHMNNLAVQQAKGEIIALLNNDLQIIHADWLQELVAHALRPEVGAVGAKLYYPDDTVQHAGVHLSAEGIGWHTLKHLPREELGYYGKLQLAQNYSAVTAACLVMRKAVFEQVNGFDTQLKIAFNDVDLCLKLRQLGYDIVWTPFAELYHLESVSRGDDTTLRQHLRLRQELVTMQTRWQSVLADDPFYHPQLDTASEAYQFAYPPRNRLI